MGAGGIWDFSVKILETQKGVARRKTKGLKNREDGRVRHPT